MKYYHVSVIKTLSTIRVHLLCVKILISAYPFDAITIEQVHY